MCSMKLAAVFHLVLINGFFFTTFASETQATLDNQQQEPAKRASSGFMPMRGRRDDHQEHGYFADFQQDKRSSSGFMPMRGKKETNGMWPVNEDELAKRTSGFMPMRGRRMDSGPEYGYILEQQPRLVESLEEKRGSSGFMPMRGKKSPDEMYLLEPKRAFHALRGKKWSNDAAEELVKRGNAFFGMRG